MQARIALIVLLTASTLHATDYHARRDRLASKLGNGVLVLFAATEGEGQNAIHGFRQNEDFYYLTGWSEPGAAVVVAAGTEILFLPAHNVSQERWTGPKLGADSPDAAKITGFAKVAVLDHLRDELVRILPSPVATVYTDIGESVPTPSTIPIAWLARANAFPNYISFLDAKPLIADLRTVKDADEIALLRKAANATVMAHAAAMGEIKPGKTENEIAGVIEFEFRRQGCEGPAFSSIVGSCANSTVLHYSKLSGTLRDGDVVVIDIGAECGMYASDVTRTLPVSGTFTRRQREIYDAVLGAQKAAIAAYRPGVSTVGRDAPNSLHRVAWEFLEKRGLAKYFIHGTSHYVGLSVHDAGDRSKPLQPGAVFTIEPGVYIPEEKIGVRIEDTFLVRADGTLECLSCAAPK